MGFQENQRRHTFAHLPRCAQKWGCPASTQGLPLSLLSACSPCSMDFGGKHRDGQGGPRASRPEPGGVCGVRRLGADCGFAFDQWVPAWGGRCQGGRADRMAFLRKSPLHNTGTLADIPSPWPGAGNREGGLSLHCGCKHHTYTHGHTPQESTHWHTTLDMHTQVSYNPQPSSRHLE